MESRRKFLQKAVYAAPLILTVAVRPSFAGSGYTGGVTPGNGGGGGNNISSPPGGGSSVHGGGKDAHDWWMFWRKL